MLAFPALHKGGCKEEENLCLSICNRKLFYHPNVVKLLFDKNCESWTSQSSVPGDRADAGDKAIPGKLSRTLPLFHLMFGCTDTWWQLGVGNGKLKKKKNFSLSFGICFL